MIEAGLKNERTIRVTDELTAVRVGSGSLPVYATPAMIALMEGTCEACAAPYLGEGEGTVGTAVDIKHIAATPVGMNVRCTCELKEVRGRMLVFAVEAFDEKKQIGTGTHTRAIIDNARFMSKLS